MTALTASRRAPSSPLVRALAVVGVVIVLTVLLVFFVLPVIWLLLAPTKTDLQLVRDFPLSFGSFEQLATVWNHLTSFQDGVIFTWFRNSAIYSVGSLIITLLTAIPAGYGLALTRFAGRRVLLTI